MRNLATAATPVQVSRRFGCRPDAKIKTAASTETSTAANGLIEKKASTKKLSPAQGRGQGRDRQFQNAGYNERIHQSQDNNAGRQNQNGHDNGC